MLIIVQQALKFFYYTEYKRYMKMSSRSGRSSRKARFITGFFLLVLITAGYAFSVFVVDNAFSEVVPGLVYRSAQPSPDRLVRWIKRYHLRTILNLRGPNAPMAPEEKIAAEKAGCSVIYVEISAFKQIPRDKLLRLIRVLETAEKPMLLHCRSGVDRSGTASALAGWLLGGESYYDARWRAYVPPGPWKTRKGGRHISSVFTDYENFCRKRNLNPDDFERFRRWADKFYRPVVICNLDKAG